MFKVCRAEIIRIVNTCVCLQVYEVTIIEAEDEDSFDEDTEITEAVSLDTNKQTNRQKSNTHAA